MHFNILYMLQKNKPLDALQKKKTCNIPQKLINTTLI
jgi:hypothetical protein